MTARTQLVVLYHDHQHMYFPVGPDRGWKVDNASRCLVIGKFPRTYIPLDSVRSFDIEAIGGNGAEVAGEFDPCPVGDPDCETGDDGSCHDGCTPQPAGPLERLHFQVCAALGGAPTAETKARSEGRDGDALLNAARVDAFDWMLQRLDEEMGR